MADITTINASDSLAASRAIIVANFAALQNTFASSVAPASPVAYQMWWDTTTAASPILKVRNSTNSAWVTIMPNGGATGGGFLPLTGGTMTGAIAMGTNKITGGAAATAAGDFTIKSQIDGIIHPCPVSIPGIPFSAATYNFPLFVAPAANTVISDCKIISDTTTSGSSGGSNYTFQVANVTAGNNLRSAAKSTNGAEITANTNYALALDQNLTVAAGDLLRLVVVETGTPTNLSAAKLIAQINWKVTL